MTAAGVGLTLTSACHVIFAELFWNPGTLLQCEDRAHRIGQKRPVTVEYVVAKDTFDEQLWELIEKKMGILGSIFDGVLDSLDAAASAASDEAATPDDIPVDDSLLQWILKKAFSWDERQENTQKRRAARRALLESENSDDVTKVIVLADPNGAAEPMDHDQMVVEPPQLYHPDDTHIEEIQIDEDEPAAMPVYDPAETARRLSRFARPENLLSSLPIT